VVVLVGAGTQIMASSFSGMSAATGNADGLINVGVGGWLSFASVDFGKTGAKALRIQLAGTAANAKGLKIRVRADSADGTIIGTINPTTGRRAVKPHVQTAHARKLTGVHDIYLQVLGRSGTVEMGWFSFQLIPSKAG
jgi:hypothetical protein